MKRILKSAAALALASVLALSAFAADAVATAEEAVVPTDAQQYLLDSPKLSLLPFEVKAYDGFVLTPAAVPAVEAAEAAVADEDALAAAADLLADVDPALLAAAADLLGDAAAAVVEAAVTEDAAAEATEDAAAEATEDAAAEDAATEDAAAEDAVVEVEAPAEAAIDMSTVKFGVTKGTKATLEVAFGAEVKNVHLLMGDYTGAVKISVVGIRANGDEVTSVTDLIKNPTAGVTSAVSTFGKYIVGAKITVEAISDTAEFGDLLVATKSDIPVKQFNPENVYDPENISGTTALGMGVQGVWSGEVRIPYAGWGIVR